MAGMAIPLNNGLIFRPSTLLRYTPNAPLNIDLNASFLFNDLFGLGVSYRSSNAFIFMFEFNITENLRLGYSYDTYLNQLKAYNKGSHEIMLGFDIGLKRSRMLTPRYF